MEGLKFRVNVFETTADLAPNKFLRQALGNPAKDISKSSEMLRGEDLKKAVKTVGENVIARVRAEQRPSFNPLFEAIYDHLDELDSRIWEKPRSIGEKNAFYTSTTSALQYWYLRNYGTTIKGSQLSMPEACNATVEHVLQNSEHSDLFYDNIWHLPVTFIPDRAIPLQYILSHHFGDTPITGIDIGAGIGTLPLINSPRLLNTHFEDKEKLFTFLGNPGQVNIQLGLSVDKTIQEENILWAQTNQSAWATEKQEKDFNHTLKEIQNITDKTNRFPFITSDIKQPHAVKNIQNMLARNGKQHADFVTSSFVRQQLGDDQDTQNAFIDKITALLRKGGIWIDVGEELMDQNTDFQSYHGYQVKVYQKTDDGKLIELGVPFIFGNDATTLQKMNFDYFRGHKKDSAKE